MKDLPAFHQFASEVNFFCEGREEVKEARERAKSADVWNPLDGLGVRGCLNGSSSA